MASVAHHSVKTRVVDRPAAFAERVTIWAICSFALAGVMSEVLGQTLLFSFGFYSFHVVDLPVVLSMWAAALNIVDRRHRFDMLSVLATVITAIIFANLTRGLLSSPSGALLTFRGNAGVATVLLMATTMRPTRLVIVRTQQALVFAATALLLLEALRLVFGPTLFMTYDISALDVNDGGRPLSVNGAFIMLLAEAILLARLLKRGSVRMAWGDILAVMLAPAILLTGQGTGSVAALIVVAILLVLQHGPHRAERLAIFLFGALAVPLYLIAHSVSVSENALLQHRFDNLNTRKMIWSGLVDAWPKQSYIYQLFGYPDGQAPSVYIFGYGKYYLWKNSMHSMYFGSLPMMGYIGQVCFFLIIFIVMFKVHPFSRKQQDLGVLVTPFACCAAILLLSYSYEVRNEALLGLVVPIWWARALALTRKPVETRTRRARRGSIMLANRGQAQHTASSS